MATGELVLVDTCTWAPFFNRPHSREKQAVDLPLDEDRAALTGPILAEVLLGFRRDAQADGVASELRGLHFLQTTWDHWRAAARIGRELMANGHVLPLSDFAIADVALERGLAVYSTDPHFDLIAGLKRYAPKL